MSELPMPSENDQEVFRWLGLADRPDLALVRTTMQDIPVTVIVHFPDPKGTDMIPVAILVDEKIQDLLTPPACQFCGEPTGCGEPGHTHD